MPYINNNGIKIHYEVEGKGKYLVLHHGFYGSLEDWYEYGYVEALKDDYTLIMLDARGFGRSDKPYDPALYVPELRGYDVIKVLDSVGADNCYYMGYSMGGWIAYNLMKDYQERFEAFVLNGIHPYKNDMLQMQEAIRTMEAWLPDRKMSNESKKRFLENDRKAMLAAAQDVRRDNTLSLKNLKLPCLMMAGEADIIYDKVSESSKLSSLISFTPIPGCDHSGSLQRSDLTVPIVKAFLARLNK